MYGRENISSEKEKTDNEFRCRILVVWDIKEMTRAEATAVSVEHWYTWYTACEFKSTEAFIIVRKQSNEDYNKSIVVVRC